MVVGEGLEPSKPKATDLQSVGFDHSPTPPICYGLTQCYDNGAGERTRTTDRLITSEMLYQLSYTSIQNSTMVARGRIELPTQGFSVLCSTD